VELAEVVLRGYRGEDLTEICRLDEACFAKAFRFSRGSMRQFVERKGAIVVVAEWCLGGETRHDECIKIVGFVVVHVERSGRGYVVTLDVAEEWRRRGLAGAMMEEAETQARVAGAVGMELHVYSGNEGAIGFYEGRGYQRMGVVKSFYGRGMDAFVYRKD
jgi:[ribosomal protein S18]-alanine N-acetyltransferase